jgi:hypothetical protein
MTPFDIGVGDELPEVIVASECQVEAADIVGKWIAVVVELQCFRFSTCGSKSLVPAW